MIEAVLFDWDNTLVHFTWDDELLAAGHRPGSRALGREDEAAEFTERFRERRARARHGAADAYAACCASCSATLADDELDRVHRRRARGVASGHAAARRRRTRCSRRCTRAAQDRRRRQTLARPGPRAPRETSSELGLTERFDVIVFSAEVGVRKPDAGIFQTRSPQLGVDPLEAMFVGDRLDDRLQARPGGHDHRSGAVVPRRRHPRVEPDFLAFTPMDVAERGAAD